jgi:hypothetical protein
VNVEHNCSFVISHSNLSHPAKVRADDSGIWKNNGVRRCIVNWEYKIAELVAHDCKDHKMTTPNSYNIHRTNYVHTSHGDFITVITRYMAMFILITFEFYTDCNNSFMGLILIQY